MSTGISRPPPHLDCGQLTVPPSTAPLAPALQEVDRQGDTRPVNADIAFVAQLRVLRYLLAP